MRTSQVNDMIVPIHMPQKNIKQSRVFPTAIDLFSGCGGLTLGLKDAGFRVVAAIEIDPKIAATYTLNHPETQMLCKDIRKVNPTDLMRELGLKKGQLGLVAGCPPCQGFSTIGTQNEDDRRNDLVFEYLRFVEAFLPRAVMLENVPGLLKNIRVRKLIAGLEKLGYRMGNTPKVLDASNYGVPQRRKRMIIVGGYKQEIPMPEPSSTKVSVKDAIGNMPRPGNSGDLIHDYPEKRGSKVLEIIKLIPKNGGSRRQLEKKYQLPCHIRYPDGYKDVYGRMSWDEVSPTITGGCTNPSKGRFLHPTQNRAITLREAALLQSFPKTYKFDSSVGKELVSLMIGNALPPKFIKAHAQAIAECL